MIKVDKDNTLEESTQVIGYIVDMPFEDFKEELVKQKVSVGVMNNLILLMESIYFDFRNRKEALIKSVFENRLTKEETEKAINGLYAEMTKLEQKIVYLKDRVKELSNVG